MMSIAIKFIRRRQGGGNPLRNSTEEVVWAGPVSPREHLLFWVPRTVPWFVLWIVLWTLVARRWFDPSASNIKSLVDWLLPSALALVGLYCLLLVPWLAYRSRHLEYVLTRDRVLRIDRHAHVTIFVRIEDIDRVELIPGWGDDVGSIKIQAGEIAGAEGWVPLYFRIVALRDFRNAARALNTVIAEKGRGGGRT
jgi:hypothetical protein